MIGKQNTCKDCKHRIREIGREDCANPIYYCKLTNKQAWSIDKACDKFINIKANGYKIICNMEEYKEFIESLITIQNASHILKCSVQTVHNKIKRGELELVVIDGVKFVRIN